MKHQIRNLYMTNLKFLINMFTADHILVVHTMEIK